VYDFQSHHDLILVPVVLRHWRLEDVQGLDSGAEQARERTLGHIDRVGRIARRIVERRELQPAS
jgi:acyl-[acyl-carrier-protein] desaturase